MGKSKICFLVLIIAVIYVFMPNSQASETKYVGVKKCKICHKSKKRGNQYGKWLKTRHAHAFEVLKTDKAKKTAKTKGIADPTTAAACLKCHTTGLGKAATANLTKEEGVSCESCHGPGSKYKKNKIMKNLAKAKENGLIIPTEKVCKKCHNEESPYYKPFDFAKSFAKIKHPRPKK